MAGTSRPLGRKQPTPPEVESRVPILHASQRLFDARAYRATGDIAQQRGIPRFRREPMTAEVFYCKTVSAT